MIENFTLEMAQELLKKAPEHRAIEHRKEVEKNVNEIIDKIKSFATNGTTEITYDLYPPYLRDEVEAELKKLNFNPIMTTEKDIDHMEYCKVTIKLA